MIALENDEISDKVANSLVAFVTAPDAKQRIKRDSLSV